jgi:hypothetical protein
LRQYVAVYLKKDSATGYDRQTTVELSLSLLVGRARAADCCRPQRGFALPPQIKTASPVKEAVPVPQFCKRLILPIHLKRDEKRFYLRPRS